MACISAGAVQTHGREDGASEEKRNEADEDARGTSDSAGWDAGENHAAEHQESDNHEHEVDHGVVLEGSGPARGCLVSLAFSDPVYWGKAALIVPVVILYVSLLYRFLNFPI